MQEVLPEGGVIRKLWVGETAKYREHILRLDPESRRNRFAGGVSDDFIRKYVDLTNCARRGRVRLFHWRHDARRGRIAAARHPLCRARRKPRSASKSRGRATASARRCCARTLLAARNRGFRHLHMACIAENRRMQQLARKFDAELSFDFESVVGEVESSRPTPMSLMRELMSDSHGFATAMLDLQTRMLRA